VSASGSLLGEEILAAYYGAWDVQPAVAYKSVRDEYLVVW
jgi:hypothetical protein